GAIGRLLSVISLPFAFALHERGPSLPKPPELAIEHVTLIDVAEGGARAEMTVIVSGNRIVVVEPSLTARVPSGAERIAATGMFLIPGLWDMHVNPAHETDLGLFVANGVTGARIMDGEPRHLEWRRRISRGEWLGPRLVIAGPLVDGPAPAGFDG